MNNEYDEFHTVLALRASVNWNDPLWNTLPAPVQNPGESLDDFTNRIDAADASKYRVLNVGSLPKGAVVLQCVQVFAPAFEGGSLVLATSNLGDEGVVKDNVIPLSPIEDTQLWLRKDGDVTKGRVTLVVTYVREHPVAATLAPATEYPKSIGSGHDTHIVKSRQEEDEYLKAQGLSPAGAPNVGLGQPIGPTPVPTSQPQGQPAVATPNMGPAVPPPPPPPAPPVRP